MTSEFREKAEELLSKLYQDPSTKRITKHLSPVMHAFIEVWNEAIEGAAKIADKLDCGECSVTKGCGDLEHLETDYEEAAATIRALKRGEK